MKRYVIISLFVALSVLALLLGVSCSNQTPNSALVPPLQTVSANNPTWTFTPTFTFTPTPTITATPIPYPIGGFNGPLGIAVDSVSSSGMTKVYVADTNNNLIKQFINGAQAVWPSGKAKSASGISYSTPKAIAVDNNGNIYVVGNGSGVAKYDLNGNFKVLFTDSMSTTLDGLACSATTLYVSDAGLGKIYAFSLTTGVGSVLTTPPYAPHGLAVDTVNNVLFVSADSASVVYSAVYGYSLSSPTSASATITGFNKTTIPAGLAVDSAHNLYVSDTGNDQVEEFAYSSGYPISPSLVPVPFNGAVSVPQGIAVDNATPNNNVYIVDSGNNSLNEYVAP